MNRYTFLSKMNNNETRLEITTRNMYLLDRLNDFSNLEYLAICICPIKHIKFLPNTLKVLDICSNHFLETIDNIPINLEKIIICRNTRLKNIPKIISNKLINCNIYHNNLDKLELDTPNLEVLNCSNNNIKTLINLPNKLKILDCSDNLLEKIIIPNNLFALGCSNNNIKEFTYIPNSLTLLLCNNNLLEFNNIDEIKIIIKFRNIYYKLKFSKIIEKKFLNFIKKRKYYLHSELLYDPKRNFYKLYKLSNI